MSVVDLIRVSIWLLIPTPNFLMMFKALTNTRINWLCSNVADFRKYVDLSKYMAKVSSAVARGGSSGMVNARKWSGNREASGKGIYCPRIYSFCAWTALVNGLTCRLLKGGGSRCGRLGEGLASSIWYLLMILFYFLMLHQSGWLLSTRIGEFWHFSQNDPVPFLVPKNNPLGF